MAKQFLILFSILSEILAAKDYAITKYKFVGYRNVWHNGQDHTVSTHYDCSSWSSFIIDLVSISFVVINSWRLWGFQSRC